MGQAQGGGILISAQGNEQLFVQLTGQSGPRVLVGFVAKKGPFHSSDLLSFKPPNPGLACGWLVMDQCHQTVVEQLA